MMNRKKNTHENEKTYYYDTIYFYRNSFVIIISLTILQVI